MRMWLTLLATLALCPSGMVRAAEVEPVYPGKDWSTKEPEQVGLKAAGLKAFSDYAGGFGCIVRHGHLVYSWGDASRRMDVASAAKPVYAHFLFKALEDGRIFNLDEPVALWEPRLLRTNPDLAYKDSRITWRHMANQTSCYELAEEPGTAYDYNDWQMALLFDTLFTKVYGAAHLTVDAQVLRPQLTDLIGCQDAPTFLAFGVKDRAGRLAISPRDFARFGLLYLRGGNWNGRQLLSPELVRMAVTDPVPNGIPRAGRTPAEMIPGQRSIGSKRIPDNQTDHMGSYSWLWWINGVDAEAKRHWPDAPVDAFGCFGHGGKRAMVVLPGLDLIVSWNNTRVQGPDMENKALSLLTGALTPPRKRRGDDAPLRVEMWSGMMHGASYAFKVTPGSPFDVPGVVKFRHLETGRERRTGIYAVGRWSWNWRFTPTLPGLWTYEVQTEWPGQNGKSGIVDVSPAAGPADTGFLTHVGNKFAIQVRDENDLHGYLFNVYMGRVNQSVFLEEFGSDLEEVEEKALAYLDEARANGFEIIFVHVNNNWFKFGTRRHDEHDSVEPDLLTFAVLETIIRAVHANGGRVHLWAWGDESRKWTPRGVKGGINGEADRRLQRYIAARLGPQPGWTMGYGFDLHEWTSEAQVNAWADYLHEHMGWQHLLCARGFRLHGPHNINAYDGFGRNVPLATTAHGPAGYEEIVEDLNSDVTKPHLYEERHSYLREGFDLDMDGTRRLLWWQALAGGMGGFYGFYPTSPHPYPNPEQLRNHYDFWHKGGRFRLDMQPANDLLEDGYALWSPATERGVFYAEDTEGVSMELPTPTDLRPLATWNTREDPGGSPTAVVTTVPPGGSLALDPLPSSDWAYAVGDFGQSPAAARAAFGGGVTVDETCPQWPIRLLSARDAMRPFFMCGPGDPEDFLYRGTLNPDGTRDGDQMALIEKLKDTGANCIYLMAVRSHGGDGDETHNPFYNHDPSRDINPRVLDQWERWFAQMDGHGIVIYFFLYDDSVNIWRTGDDVGEPERKFVETLVDRFEHHGNLIWCIAEEYSEALTAERVRKIAALINATDDNDHPIAVHKLNGLDFSEFADDPHIDQFAIQYNVKTAEELHAGILQAWRDAKGRYSLNLSEAADWGTGAEARQKAWACAMAGAHVMVLGMDIAATPEADLRACGYLTRFFADVDLCGMEPRDELAHGSTQYVLAARPLRYVVYTSRANEDVGIKDMSAGMYAFRWLDCAGGRVEYYTTRTSAEQFLALKKPAGFGREVVVYIHRRPE